MTVLQINVFHKSRKELGLTLPTEVGVKHLYRTMIDCKAAKKKFRAYTMDIPLDFSDVVYLQKIIDEFHEHLKQEGPYINPQMTETLVEGEVNIEEPKNEESN